MVFRRFILRRSMCEEDGFFTHLLLLLEDCIDERRWFIISWCIIFTIISPQFLHTSWAVSFELFALKKVMFMRFSLFWFFLIHLSNLLRLLSFEKDHLLSLAFAIIIEIVVSRKPEQHGGFLQSGQLINHSSDHSYSGFDLILSQKIM